MIMRYQRISPDSLPLSNGRRTSSTSNSNWKAAKEDEDRGDINGNVTIKSSSTFEGKGLSRFRSPSRTAQEHHIGNGAFGAEVPNSPPTTAAASTRNYQNLESTGVVGGGGDTFLQWGHRKRSRCSRGMALTDDTSSATSSLQYQSTKLQRRSSVPNSSSPNANLMPPPSLTPNGTARGPTLKPQNKAPSSTPSPVRRNLEERSAGGGGVAGNKSPPPSNIGGGGGSSSRAISSRSRVGKRSPSLDRKNHSSGSTRDEKMNGCSLQQQQQNQEAFTSDVNNIVSPPQQGGCSRMNDDNHANDNNAARPAKLGGGGGGGGEKVHGGAEVNEWPRIYVPLSRKEKEEDFLAMKGTKLPQRPKKRPKTVERILQYCFPGLWLPDLTRGRYEVREKKCPRKPKRRGLKGMESMDSDSE